MDAGAELTGADVFSLIWEALADLLGTATTAVILRRAAQRAVVKCPELGELEISLRELEYRYTVPQAWSDDDGQTPAALKILVAELLPLLLDLTGPIAVRRLEQIPELRGRRIFAPETEEKTS